ncbi:hypothetical protein V8E53_009823 [Lactarius tabidus]
MVGGIGSPNTVLLLLTIECTNAYVCVCWMQSYCCMDAWVLLRSSCLRSGGPRLGVCTEASETIMGPSELLVMVGVHRHESRWLTSAMARVLQYLVLFVLLFCRTLKGGFAVVPYAHSS